MKQYITKQQWNELTEKQLESFCVSLNHLQETEHENFEYPSIGRMIEFLGEGLHRIDLDDETVSLNYDECSGDSGFETQELADSLWEAVKFKLNEKSK